MKAKATITLDLDLLGTTTLAVLDNSALTRAALALSASRAIRHVKFECQLCVLVGGDVHLSNREVLVLSSDLWAARVIIGSLAHDSLAIKLCSLLHASLTASCIEAVLARKAGELKTIIATNLTCGHIAEVPATCLLTFTLVIGVLRIGERLSIVPAVVRHSLL